MERRKSLMARSGDGLVLRGKTWWLDFTHQGQRHQLRLGREISKTVARELAAVQRAKVLKGEAGIGRRKCKDIAFDKASEEFLKWAEANKRPKTVSSYRDCIKQLKKSFGGKTLRDIHPFLIEKHKQRRLAAGVRVAVNRELTCLKEIFYKAIDWDNFEGANPCRRVKKVEEPLNKLRFLSEEEERRLLISAKEPLRTMILSGIYAGLRIHAEALTLKKSMVDFARKLITVEAAYAKNKETETIPLNSKLLNALKSLEADGTEAQKRSDFVFSKQDGTPYRSIRSAFTTACRRANVSAVTPHTLRHTFASRLGMTGANDRTMQALGRWKEPKMLQRYAHLSEKHLAEAVEKIGQDSTTQFTTLDTKSAVNH
jgi:site-specific recombinase XerD